MVDHPGLFAHGPAEAMHGRGAVFSDDGVYRYRLWRVWDPDRLPTAFVMLNPSTADASVDDPTIRRCVGFARSWGAGGTAARERTMREALLARQRYADAVDAAARVLGCDVGTLRAARAARRGAALDGGR